MESGDSREICVISFRLRQSETIESFKLTKQRNRIIYVTLYFIFNHYDQFSNPFYMLRFFFALLHGFKQFSITF